MIKLKNLISEIFHVWNQPKGAPEEVVNVLHRIIFHIMKDEDDSPFNWISIQRLNHNSWEIKNKKKYHWSLIFNPNEKNGIIGIKKRCIFRLRMKS